jgi:hypothetical protein
MNWISTRDRLPECNVDILFYTDCEQIKLGYRNHYPKDFECGNYHDPLDAITFLSNHRLIVIMLLGVIMNKAKIIDRIIVDSNQCWIWQGATKTLNGYGHLTIGSRSDGTRKTVSAHRYSYRCFNGVIPKGLWVLHKCDVPSCVNPEHLYLGNRQDNVNDRERNNRNKTPCLKHENHPKAKLTWEHVNSIRGKATGKRGEVTLMAKKYKVNHHTISDVLRLKTWLPEPPKE